MLEAQDAPDLPCFHGGQPRSIDALFADAANSYSEDAVFKISLKVALLLLLNIGPAVFTSGSQGPHINVSNQQDSSVLCSAMEVFTDQRLSVRAIVFHQANKTDGPRLGSLLADHTGEAMELRTAEGQRCRATVFRVKSAFGRGLMLLPLSAPALAAHDQFRLSLITRN